MTKKSPPLTSATPTLIEKAHYGKLAGRQITAILWEEMEGRTLPVLLLTG